jgi:hypothetical protein
MDNLLTMQGGFIAYANDFKLLMWVTIVSIPLALLIRSVRKGRIATAPSQPVHAMD